MSINSQKIEIRSIFGYSKNIVLIIVYDDAQWETFYILNKIHHMLPVIRSCFSLFSSPSFVILYNFYINVSLLLWMLINVVHSYKDTAIILTKWSNWSIPIVIYCGSIERLEIWFFFSSLVSKLLCFVHHKALLNVQQQNSFKLEIKNKSILQFGS